MGNLVTKDRKTVKMVCPCDPGELGVTMHTAPLLPAPAGKIQKIKFTTDLNFRLRTLGWPGAVAAVTLDTGWMVSKYFKWNAPRPAAPPPPNVVLTLLSSFCNSFGCLQTLGQC